LHGGLESGYNECVVLSLAREHPATEACFQRFLDERVLKRLRNLDVRGGDPLVRLGAEPGAGGAAARNDYGVFNLSWQAPAHPEWAAQVVQEVSEIRARIRQAQGVPLRNLIWAGMGGSIEDKNMYQAAGLLKRGIRFYALDSTDPAKLKYILMDLERRSRRGLAAGLRSTLVVAMAMGMTSYEPVVNLEKLARLYETHQIDSRENFLYMTLPGSRLDQFAAPRGYRRVDLQLDGQYSTAGRHSGPLTRGSLYPLALAGVDLHGWMAGTFLEEAAIHTAWRLAAFLHAHGVAGRDKVTLLLPKAWCGAAVWSKQDFEESLGKREDLGIKIVIGARTRLAHYRGPKDPGQDRVFLAVRLKGQRDPTGQRAMLVRRAGYPLAVLTFPADAPLSRYMQFMHYVVFGLAYLRDMNFVTQPGVELYKSIAQRLYAQASQAGGTERTAAWKAMAEGAMTWGGAVTLCPGARSTAVAGATDAPAIYSGMLKDLAARRQIEYGELTFFGDTRYNPAGRAVRRVLDRAAERLFAARLRLPADVYEGPAVNHSYHEMIIGHGRCFSTILMAQRAEELPEIDYRAEYHRTQFLATKLALEQRGRAVVALILKDLGPRSLAVLEDFFKRAAAK
jgi:glucose-6-phosphate isomerase